MSVLCSPWFTAAFNFCTMAGGVPAGRKMPIQVSSSTPGKPDSAKVGTSGSAATRVALDTASARSLPDLTKGSGVARAPAPMLGSPATTAAADGPAPRKWIAGMSSFANTLNRFSAVRCGVVPLPGEAKASLPPLATASSSARFFACTLGCTKIRFACLATTATGMKSRSAS